MGFPFMRKSNLRAARKKSYTLSRNPICKTFALEIRTSLLRAGSTGILKFGKGYWWIIPRSIQAETVFEIGISRALLRVITTAQISHRPNNLVTTPLAKRFQILFLRRFWNVQRSVLLRVWGRVGVDSPPYLVLPLTVEPTKPRLCLDASIGF